MATAHMNLTDRILVYQDVLTTNAPKKVIIDETLSVIKDYTQKNKYDLNKIGPFTQDIDLPTCPASFVYILTDQTISIRFNGEVDNNCSVSPSVSGTKDGMLIKRGNFTALSIFCDVVDLADITVFVGV